MSMINLLCVLSHFNVHTYNLGYEITSSSVRRTTEGLEYSEISSHVQVSGLIVLKQFSIVLSKRN